MKEFGFWIFVLAVLVLFAGEPDLHSKLVQRMDCRVSAGGGNG